MLIFADSKTGLASPLLDRWPVTKLNITSRKYAITWREPELPKLVFPGHFLGRCKVNDALKKDENRGKTRPDLRRGSTQIISWRLTRDARDARDAVVMHVIRDAWYACACAFKILACNLYVDSLSLSMMGAYIFEFIFPLKQGRSS